MLITFCDTPEEAIAHTTNLLATQIQKKPNAIMGFATGGTVLPVYAQLRTLFDQGKLSFSDISSFNLDEYIGLAPEHPCSYWSYMREHLFDHVDIKPENVHLPVGNADDPDLAAKLYDQLIVEKGPIDMQLLGIGQNGHIGFNEPFSSLGSRTRTKGLTESTRKANQIYFDSYEETPTSAITMGIQTIMEAKTVVMLAVGKAKAKAIKTALEGPVSSLCPASVLQYHPEFRVILDSEAASELEFAPSYSFA